MILRAGMLLARGRPNRLMVKTAQGDGGRLFTWLVFVLAVMASFGGGVPSRKAAWVPALPLRHIPRARSPSPY